MMPSRDPSKYTILQTQVAIGNDVVLGDWPSLGGQSSPHQIPRLFQVFPTEALIIIKPPEVYTGFLPICQNQIQGLC